MSIETINVGSAANDGTGDPLRTAFEKINNNFFTPITIGSTILYPGNTTSTLSNVTFSNITISGNTSYSDLTVNGNLTFEGNGRRVYANLSDPVFANRAMFQTTSANSNTIVSAIPSGTAQSSGFDVFNASDPTNASRGRFLMTSVHLRIASLYTGTGNTLPISFQTDASERMRIDTNGNVTINANTILGAGSTNYVTISGSTTDPTIITNAGNLALGSNVSIPGTARRFTGDFSNSTRANRLLFQTSTANSQTSFCIVPSGSATASRFSTFAGADPDNTTTCSWQTQTGASSILFGNTGTGTWGPLTIASPGALGGNIGEMARFGEGNTADVYLGGNTTTKAVQVIGSNISSPFANCITLTGSSGNGRPKISTTTGTALEIASGLNGSIIFSDNAGGTNFGIAYPGAPCGNWMTVQGAASGGGIPSFLADGDGTDANVSIQFLSKAAGSLYFGTNRSSPSYALSVKHVASATNRWQIQGSASGSNTLYLGAFGTVDNDVPIGFYTKGNGNVYFQSNTTTSTEFAVLASGTGSTRYITIKGASGTNNPLIGTSSGNIGMSGNATASGSMSVMNATATPAGGAAATGYFMGSANVGIYFGSGAPTISAVQGSLYLRTDGTASNRFYINNNGSTGWTAY